MGLGSCCVLNPFKSKTSKNSVDLRIAFVEPINYSLEMNRWSKTTMNTATDYFTFDSYQFDQVESEQIHQQLTPLQSLQNLIDNLETHINDLPPEIKAAYDAYWQNEIATMEM